MAEWELFGMTGKGRCSEWQGRDAVFGMAEWGWLRSE